jgi:LPXTG-site transpeptidase (sortase) family protein
MESVLFLLLALAFLCSGIYFMFFYNWDAYRRQGEEESIAVSYIDYLIEHAEDIETEQESNLTYTPDYAVIPGLGEESTAQEYPTADENGVIKMQMGSFNDDTYYERNGVTFTPDYAVGYLFCVLEYPNVGIRRGVYSGTWDDIYDDLDLWMVTMARPDMELGRTHLAIYGHNHTAQNLSFNNLKNAAIGDMFYLYAESGIYTYEVTDIFSDGRTDTTKKYVDDFSVGSDICYIITCGRDNFLIGGQSTRYQDFIVEGHLSSVISLSEYAKDQLEEERRWSEK